MSITIKSFTASVATFGLLATHGYAQTSAPASPVKASNPAPIVRPNTPSVSPAQGGFEAAIQALRLNQWQEAVRLYTPLVNSNVPEQRAQARYGLAIAFSQLGEDAKALNTLDGTLQDNTPLGRAIGELRGNLLLQLADRHLAEQGFGAANPWLGQYERLMNAPNRGRFERIMAASQSYTTPGTLRVGVMLPMQGPLAEAGMSVLHGLQLGIKEFDGRGGLQMELLALHVQDADDAKKAAKILKDQQVDIVIGPLLAPAVTEAGAVFTAQNTPVLALSNDRSVLGRGVYTLNYLPGEQARLVARAAVSAGKQRLAVLAPTSAYGSEASEAFADEVRRLNATLTGTSFYDPKATDIGGSIRNVVGTTGGVPFDALFVPAPARNMALLKAQLNYYDVDKANVLLLGTGLWQSNDLLKPGTGMQGAIFTAPPKAFAFEDNYLNTFGSKPNALAVVGYDAARILADIGAEKARTGKTLNELLLRPEGFYGTGGYFQFTENGLSKRGLDVVKVGSQFSVQAPALTLPPLPVPADLQPAGNPGRWFVQ